MTFWQQIIQDPLLGSPVLWVMALVALGCFFFSWLDSRADQWIRERQRKEMLKMLRSDRGREMYRKVQKIVEAQQKRPGR